MDTKRKALEALSTGPVSCWDIPSGTLGWVKRNGYAVKRQGGPTAYELTDSGREALEAMRQGRAPAKGA